MKKCIKARTQAKTKLLFEIQKSAIIFKFLVNTLKIVILSKDVMA